MAEPAKTAPSAQPGKTATASAGAGAAVAAGSQRAVETATVAADGSIHFNEQRGNIASVEIADVDLLIRFADGSNLLIPNGALDALSGRKTSINFKGSHTTAAELINDLLEAQAQLNAFLRMEKLNIDLLAYYHSHPTGKGEPSATDLAEFLYPDVIMLIWYQQDDIWQAKSFSLFLSGALSPDIITFVPTLTTILLYFCILNIPLS